LGKRRAWGSEPDGVAARFARGAMDSELLKDISIPVFTGVIGYVINGDQGG
jgi:hypothetical protein